MLGLPLYLLFLVFCILKSHPKLGINAKFKRIKLLWFPPEIIENHMLSDDQGEQKLNNSLKFV